MQLLGEAEICDFEMSIPVQEEVFWLQVPVDNVEPVQVLEREDDLGGVEGTRARTEATRVAQVREQFSARYVLEQHVQAARVVVRPGPAIRERRKNKDKFTLVTLIVLRCVFQTHNLNVTTEASVLLIFVKYYRSAVGG